MNSLGWLYPVTLEFGWLDFDPGTDKWLHYTFTPKGVQTRRETLNDQAAAALVHLLYRSDISVQEFNSRHRLARAYRELHSDRREAIPHFRWDLRKFGCFRTTSLYDEHKDAWSTLVKFVPLSLRNTFFSDDDVILESPSPTVRVGSKSPIQASRVWEEQFSFTWMAAALGLGNPAKVIAGYLRPYVVGYKALIQHICDAFSSPNAKMRFPDRIDEYYFEICNTEVRCGELVIFTRGMTRDEHSLYLNNRN